MIDISIRNLTKAFEVKKNILDGLTFQVQHGERVGILGRNGAGKTTLFRLMTGEITEDRGDIDIARGKRLGLVSQIPRYPEGYTVEDVLATADARLDAMQQRMRELEKLMSVSDDRAILGEYVVKPQGKPTLVEDTDPRPAMSSAKDDFSEYTK